MTPLTKRADYVIRNVFIIFGYVCTLQHAVLAMTCMHETASFIYSRTFVI